MKSIKWKYALGEIIIVIIGLTIAFSLNSWKENKANDALKIQYLENLALDIEKEIEQLQDNELAIDAKLKLMRSLRPFLGSQAADRDTIVPKVFSLAQVVSFNPENTTYQTLINSGDMKLIGSFTLRRGIEEHYSGHQNVNEAYQRIKNINEKYFADLFIYEINFDEVRKGDQSFLDKPLLKNIVGSLEGAYMMVRLANAECIKSNQKLLEQIKSQRT